MERREKQGGVRCLNAQAAVELVMVLPILVVLMAFAVDIANLWNARSQLEAVASEAARSLSSDPSLTDGELAELVQTSSGLGDAIAVEVSREPLADKTVTMRSVDKTAEAVYRRQRATICIRAEVPTLMPLGSLGADAASSGAVRISTTSTTVLSTFGRP